MTVQHLDRPLGVPALVEATASESALRRFLHGLPGVDQVGAEARVADLGTRSIKKQSKLFALDLAIRMTDHLDKTPQFDTAWRRINRVFGGLWEREK